MRIGNVKLSGNLLLAPMAGFSDIAFRRLCREQSCALTVTEMISAKGLCYNNKKTFELLCLAPNESPSCVQLFGSQPEVFVRAAQSEALNKFDIIDINMGCPMPKITRNDEGSALLKNERLAAKIVETLVGAGKTVTVKMRIGIDKPIDYTGFARAMQDSGAAAVTVHGRTAAQLYAGKADYDAIGKVAQMLTIPVIASGDIATAAEALDKIKTYSLAGAMAGRGAIGNPWLFSEYAALVSNSAHVPRVPSKPETADMILKHFTYMQKYFPERIAITNLRKHLAYYLKNFPGVKELRRALNAAVTAEELTALIKSLN